MIKVSVRRPGCRKIEFLLARPLRNSVNLHKLSKALAAPLCSGSISLVLLITAPRGACVDAAVPPPAISCNAQLQVALNNGSYHAVIEA